MADTIHKRRKDYPHFDKFYCGTKAFRDNYDRIFRKVKDGEEVHASRGRGKVRKAGEESPLKGSRRVYRSKEVREKEVPEDGGARAQAETINDN